MKRFDLNNFIDDLRRLRPKGRAVAAFDADGTLWDTDLGEALFQYQIKNKLVPLPNDAWNHYHRMKDEVSKRAAYLWLAQINKGVAITEVRKWAEEAVREVSPVPVFNEQKKIIEVLLELNVEVYIVTASVQWAVAPGAKLFGLPMENVLGIETEVVNGLVTDKQKGALTFREGKIQALLERTGGVAPFFAAGNTEGDQFLVEGATQMAMVVAASRPGTENFESERRMIEMAKTKGWYVQDHLPS